MDREEVLTRIREHLATELEVDPARIADATPAGIANAVRLAQRAVDERMVERTEEALRAAGALRSSETAVSVGARDD